MGHLRCEFDRHFVAASQPHGIVAVNRGGSPLGSPPPYNVKYTLYPRYPTPAAVNLRTTVVWGEIPTQFIIARNGYSSSFNMQSSKLTIWTDLEARYQGEDHRCRQLPHRR